MRCARTSSPARDRPVTELAERDARAKDAFAAELDVGFDLGP
jgi:hypothetical protein